MGPVVKVEEALGGIHSEAGGHVLVVGQCGTEADQTYVLLGQLHVPDGSGHQRLQDGPSVVVQQMDFILKKINKTIIKNIFTQSLQLVHVAKAFEGSFPKLSTELTIMMRRTSWV